MWFVLAILASPFKSKSRLGAEERALRRQLIVLRRNVHGFTPAPGRRSGTLLQQCALRNQMLLTAEMMRARLASKTQKHYPTAMRLSASPRHFRGLVIVPVLAVMFAFPASAQISSDSETQSTHAAGAAVLINIDKTKQKMTIFLDGAKKYDWPVSTGRAGYSTPSGTYTATSMNEVWYSKEWDNSPMPHSIFFMKDGHAIHGSYEVKTLGKPVSHGCVRISPENATTLYALVEKNGLENTEVVLTGVTPGGEFKVARPAAPRYSQAGPGWYEPNKY